MILTQDRPLYINFLEIKKMEKNYFFSQLYGLKEALFIKNIRFEIGPKMRELKILFSKKSQKIQFLKKKESYNHAKIMIF